MRSKTFALILAAGISGASVAFPAKAAPNVPLCFSLSQSYNQCQQQAQWQNHGGGGGYGGGYGYGGGWGGDDDDAYYWRQRRAQRAQSKQAECARWLVAMQANHCM